MYHVFDTHQGVADFVAQRMLNQILTKPDACLGLATGSTMEPIYQRLIQLLEQSSPSLSQLTTFNLDEYVGLGKSHPQSYYYYMCHHFFSHVSIPEERIHLPNGKAADLDAECQRYTAAIRAAKGLDYQLLGVGTNGHIGFNEPGTSFNSITHVVELTEQTRTDNSRFFDDPSEMPYQAITMGIQDIMSASAIDLVITGEHKAEVVANFYHSAVDENLPVSVLKKHPNATVILDKAAASLLPLGAIQQKTATL